jgi:protein TonB
MIARNDKTDLAHRLILRAAQRAPAALAPRLEEEWLADLGSRTGSLARLRLALGCCWATGVITHDFRMPQLAASGAAGPPKPLLGESPFDLPLLSRRTVAFIAIAAIHVLIIYAFASGFAQHVVATIPTLMRATVELQSQPQHPLPPPLLPTFKLKTITIERVDTVEPPIDLGTQTSEPVLTRSTEPTDRGQSVPPRALQTTPGGPGKNFPNTDDFYPAASRRLAETGAATVRVCVDKQGRLSSDPTLARTSGSRRIDDGVLNLARAGSGYYRPTLEDGEPVNSCFPFRIRFTLTN